VDPGAPGSRAVRPLELELGGDLTILTQRVRDADGDDVAYTIPTYRGFHLAARHRWDELWAFGLLGAYQWSPEVIHGTRAAMWHALVEVRAHPFRGSVNPWAGVLAGASARVISPENESQSTHAAPSGGAEIGLDVGASDWLVVNLIGRTLYTGFSDREDGRGAWVWLGLGVEGRAGPTGSAHTAAR